MDSTILRNTNQQEHSNFQLAIDCVINYNYKCLLVCLFVCNEKQKRDQ